MDSSKLASFSFILFEISAETLLAGWTKVSIFSSQASVVTESFLLVSIDGLDDEGAGLIELVSGLYDNAIMSMRIGSMATGKALHCPMGGTLPSVKGEGAGKAAGAAKGPGPIKDDTGAEIDDRLNRVLSLRGRKGTNKEEQISVLSQLSDVTKRPSKLVELLSPLEDLLGHPPLEHRLLGAVEVQVQPRLRHALHIVAVAHALAQGRGGTGLV